MDEPTHSDAAQVCAALRRRYGGRLGALYLPAADSTSSVLKSRLLHAGLAGPTLLLTDDQQQGRGTRGRSWQMQPGLDAALTLAVPYAAARHGDPRLSLAVGAAVALGLETATGLALGVKWPNDILAGAPGALAKCGGILLETAAAPRDGRRWLLAGVGVNVNSSRAMFKPELAARLATLRDVLGRPCDRQAVLSAVADALLCALLGAEFAGMPDRRFEQLLDAWFARDHTAGTRYRLRRDGMEHAVAAAGVDRASGCLRCRAADGAEYEVASYTELEPAE